MYLSVVFYFIYIILYVIFLRITETNLIYFLRKIVSWSRSVVEYSNDNRINIFASETLQKIKAFFNGLKHKRLLHRRPDCLFKLHVSHGAPPVWSSVSELINKGPINRKGSWDPVKEERERDGGGRETFANNKVESFYIWLMAAWSRDNEHTKLITWKVCILDTKLLTRDHLNQHNYS